MEFDPNAAAQFDGIYGLPDTPEEAGVVLIPVPWDATTSYRPGTAKGPQAILKASYQVDLFSVIFGHPYQEGIAMLPESDEIHTLNKNARVCAEEIIAVGGNLHGDARLEALLETVNASGERLNNWVRSETERWLDHEKLVGIVGGDHSTPYGAIQAFARRYPGMGILHLDAHADLRQAYEGFTWSHASIMYNVMTRIDGIGKLVQVGIRDLCDAEREMIEEDKRIVTYYDDRLAANLFSGASWNEQCQNMIFELPQDVYLSFDIDGLDPFYCPNTGTPVPGNLSFSHITFLLSKLAQSGRRIVGFDLNEVAPDPEEKNEWDGNVGARLLYNMIGCALESRQQKE